MIHNYHFIQCTLALLVGDDEVLNYYARVVAIYFIYPLYFIGSCSVFAWSGRRLNISPVFAVRRFHNELKIYTTDSKLTNKYERCAYLIQELHTIQNRRSLLPDDITVIDISNICLICFFSQKRQISATNNFPGKTTKR